VDDGRRTAALCTDLDAVSFAGRSPVAPAVRLRVSAASVLYFQLETDEISDVTKVVGRERELSLAEEFLNSASSRLSVLILEGEPGIGKTTVWWEVIRRAEATGFLVLSCRPALTEAKLSLAAVADLLEPVPQSILETRPDPQRRALDIALLRSDSAGATADRASAGEATGRQIASTDTRGAAGRCGARGAIRRDAAPRAGPSDQQRHGGG
jgi:hypothetical protein